MDIKQSSNLERNFDCALHTDIDTTRYGITIIKIEDKNKFFQKNIP